MYRFCVSSEVPIPVTNLVQGTKALVNHIVFLGNDSMGRALNQARSFGLEVPFYSIASVMSPGFSALAGKSLNGTLV